MNNLKEYRKRKGLTQTQLAVKTGIIQTTVSKLENGVFPLSLRTAAIFAKVLDCRPEDLIGENNVRIKVEVVRKGYEPSFREIMTTLIRDEREKIGKQIKQKTDDLVLLQLISTVLEIPDDRMMQELNLMLHRRSKLQ